jgi:predicted nucleic acid-binding protein
MARTDPPRVLIDACGLIAIIKDEPGAERLDGLLDMIDRGDVQLVESVQILGEVFKKSTAEDPATRDRQDKKLANIRALLESRDVELLDVTLPIIRRATDFRRLMPMKLPDAVHLATAQLNKCDWMVTFDRQFPEVDGMRIFRREHLVDKSFNIPWDLPGQDALPLETASDNTAPDNPASDNTVPDNVVALRPSAS